MTRFSNLASGRKQLTFKKASHSITPITCSKHFRAKKCVIIIVGQRILKDFSSILMHPKYKPCGHSFVLQKGLVICTFFSLLNQSIVICVMLYCLFMVSVVTSMYAGELYNSNFNINCMFTIIYRSIQSKY